MTEKVLIIGSGPAGLTAAIYAARANLEPLCIEGLVTGGIPGGQLMITTEVENYPGFPEGIKGPDLMKLFRDQAERFGTRFITEDVDRVDFSKRPFKAWAAGKEYQAETIVIATGAKAKWLGLENEEKLQNRGVSACATCDGYFFRDMDVHVVGGGDTAMEEALYLAGLCKSVTIIHRRDELRASKIMQDRALNHEKIKFLWSHQVVDVLDVEKNTVTGLKVLDRKTDEVREIPSEGLFIAIGHVPNTSIFKDWLDLDDLGYLVTNADTVATKIPGVFASGDVQDHVWRQAVTAAGTGCMAAIAAERFLGEHGTSG